MAFKTVLCVLGVNHNDADLKVCIELASEISGHCSVLVLAEAPTLPVGYYGDVIPDIWYQERREDMKKLQKRVDAVELIVKEAGISADVMSEYAEFGALTHVVGRRARLADVTVFGPSMISDKYLFPLVSEGALFESGRPILLAPKNCHPTLRPKNIVLAVDGSVEAMRAARETVSLMGKADTVRITLVDPNIGKAGEEPGADEAAYLTRHGAKVIVDRLPSGGVSVSEVLARHAKDQNADLLVMGAYGHSRLRERLFGGVTKSILSDPTLPILMAH